MVAQTAGLGEELSLGFEQHPDAEVVRSLTGLGTILGARVLGEFGDEPNRYATPKCRKNYAGTSPITRASGTKQVVLARHVRNRRLADAIYLWAFASLNASSASYPRVTPCSSTATCHRCSFASAPGGNGASLARSRRHWTQPWGPSEHRTRPPM
jgi:hypothetical protein